MITNRKLIIAALMLLGGNSLMGMEANIKPLTIFEGEERDAHVNFLMLCVRGIQKGYEKGAPDFRLLERYLVSIAKSLGLAERKPKIIIPNKLELTLGALSCAAVGGALGWLAHSLWNK